MIRTLAAVMILAATSASAQDLQTRNKLSAALESARTAMNDGNVVGGAVSDVLDARRTVVFFAHQAEAAKTGKDQDGRAVIWLSDALPAYPRPIALALAREAAAMILADMTPSSEREYMKASIAARAWLELGGEADKLPVIEPFTGYVNKELADGISLWASNKAEMALYLIGQSSGAPSVMKLLEAAKTDAEKAKLESENRRFISFLRREQEWRLGR